MPDAQSDLLIFISAFASGDDGAVWENQKESCAVHAVAGRYSGVTTKLKIIIRQKTEFRIILHDYTLLEDDLHYLNIIQRYLHYLSTV